MLLNKVVKREMDKVRRVIAVAQEHSCGHTALRRDYVSCVIVVCKLCELLEEIGPE